jgi:chromobox protein 1
MDDHVEYEVERILLRRFRRNRWEYLVKWAGYTEDDATWEPRANLANAADVLDEFDPASRTMPEGGGSDVMVLQDAESEAPDLSAESG